MKKVSEIIMENRKEHKKVEPSDEKPAVWTQFDGQLVDSATPVLKLKASTLAGTGKLHIQFGCPDVEGLHSDMQELLGTPYVYLADNSLRHYGASVNLMVSSGSLDEANLRQLGQDILDNKEILSQSLASDDKTYAIMQFVGIEKGQNNKGEDIMLMDFRVGSDDNRILVGFSHVESCLNTPAMNYPEMRVEWFLSWLIERYYGDMDITEEE
tara:strand:- start:426 stop:1061 length:636 start_codon:yes stop_codon:yes gene_type:complete